MTVMTLMTVIYGLILDRVGSLLVGHYPFNLPDEPDAENKGPLPMRHPNL